MFGVSAAVYFAILNATRIPLAHSRAAEKNHAGSVLKCCKNPLSAMPDEPKVFKQRIIQHCVFLRDCMGASGSPKLTKGSQPNRYYVKTIPGDGVGGGSTHPQTILLPFMFVVV